MISLVIILASALSAVGLGAGLMIALGRAAVRADEELDHLLLEARRPGGWWNTPGGGANP